MSNKRKGGDYDVGYGKPPSHSRFRKGRSGNPKGRPKGAKGFAASLSRELDSKITVREGSRTIRISKAEAAAKRTVELALKGDKTVLRMLAMFDAGSRERADRDRDGDMSNDLAGPDQTDEAVVRHFAALVANDRPVPGFPTQEAGETDEESGHDRT